MGATASYLKEDELQRYSDSTGFSTAQVQRLYRRFQVISRGEETASVENLLTIRELALNPLAERIVLLFERAGHEQNGVKLINFNQFLNTLSIFLPIGERREGQSQEDFDQYKTTRGKEKLQFIFNIYDVQEDGYIEGNELFEVLKMMVTDGITDGELSFIVDQTISEADHDGDGKISFKEFEQILAQTDVCQRMTIRF
eukprot:m.58461 g.58461  ORF g.58461 m.58461 type:complete len:199 (+) comp11691_c0_seq4:185-781(+)